VRVKGKGSGGKELPLPQLRLEGGLLAFYLLLTEPERGNASCRKTKQGFARRLLSWLRNGRKLRYIHRNPVKRGLVLEPDQCAWRQWCRFVVTHAGQSWAVRLMASVPPGGTAVFQPTAFFLATP
jgi:hypothetical protein